MAGKKENIKALFTNTRSRIIIIFTAALLIVAILIGVFRFTSSGNTVKSAADLSVAPSIQSVPGSIDPTAQYASLQQEQNVQQAKQAQEKGSSAIPTIIRTQSFGNGVESVGPQQGQGGVGFATLALEDEGGTQQSLWMQNLKDSNCSKSAVQQIVQQGGSIKDLKGGCSCVQLRDNGYQFGELQTVCTCKELKAAGYNARQMKDSGMTASQLRACGFDACELRAAGFTAQEMKDAGFSDGELKGAGYPDEEIQRASGLPDGITAGDVLKAGCQPDALRKLRAAGVSAGAIRRISGCSAAQLKAAGFTAQELKNAGFSAADLKNAGFSAADLKNAGFSARDLLNAGFTPNELASAGFTPAEIKEGEAELPPGMKPQDVKDAGCDVEALKRERLAGVSAAAIRQYAGCSAAALKAAGFSDSDLADAGFSPAEIAALSPNVDDSTIKDAGCDPEKLKALFNQGVSAKRIRELNGCSADALKAAGYDAKDLTDAGFTPQQLLAAGFSPNEVEAAQKINDDAIRAAGCDPTKLKALMMKGVSASQIRNLNGCSADALKAAGYDARALANAGFTPAELLAAGFTPEQLDQAGLNPAGVIAAGRTADCSVESLKAARAMGVSAATIKQTLGCSAEAMKAAGYSAAELRAAGFTAAELKNAGFSAAELKAAGFSAKDLHDAGFSAADLKAAGFTAAQLRDAGFSAAELRSAGFSAADLKAAGYSAKDLKEAGFSQADLKNAGFTDQELKEAGFVPPGSSVASLGGALPPNAGDSSVPFFPTIGNPSNPRPELTNAKQLQDILQKQQAQMATQAADQKSQQEMQATSSAMLSAANGYLATWKTIPTQAYIGGGSEDSAGGGAAAAEQGTAAASQGLGAPGQPGGQDTQALIKTGDVIFAVLDTSVNTDEPGPILATVVSGRFKGAKLIGSFNLPSNADKMVINFNAMSVPGAPKTTSINAYAIDPNTARTALSSSTDHHYLLRYGSLFASTFLEGFGNAFQSAGTTITIGGTGGVQQTTVQSGVGRSVLENAVIGLATVGKSWGQVAQVQFNRPTTVELCAGVGLGILFTQDLISL